MRWLASLKLVRSAPNGSVDLELPRGMSKESQKPRCGSFSTGGLF